MLKTTPGGTRLVTDDQTGAVTGAATVLRSGLQEVETNWPWNWRLTVPETAKTALVRPLMTTPEEDCQHWRGCFCLEPPPSVYKGSCPVVARAGRQPLDRDQLSFHQLPASEIKQTFLSFNLAWLLAFEQWAASINHGKYCSVLIISNYWSW